MPFTFFSALSFIQVVYNPITFINGTVSLAPEKTEINWNRMYVMIEGLGLHLSIPKIYFLSVDSKKLLITSDHRSKKHENSTFIMN